LPTATGRTYPDFVAKLKDGRLFVIEYKGGDRVSNDDSKDKAQLGHLWAKASNGTCVYLMAVKNANGMDLREQMLAAIGNEKPKNS
jgi:type III restriction enzyme